MRLLAKPLPYLGLLLGVCWLILAVDLITKDHPEKPAETSLADLEGKTSDDLPEWIKINDGIPYWPEAVIVYRERDGQDKHEKLLVPLLSKSAMDSWPNLSGKHRTGYLLEFTWDELRAQFPQVARAASSSQSEPQAGQMELRLERFPVSFRPVDSDVAYLVLSGAEKTAVGDLRNAGFSEVVVVRPGTKPLTADQGPMMAIMGLLVTAGCGYWIYRRRKHRNESANQEEPAATLEEAIENGFRKGMQGALRSQVAAGVDNALKKHREKQNAS